jgi:transcriptional regulator with XRE-family HTH domain
MDLQQRVTSRIRAIAKRKGLSITRLGEFAGVSGSYLSAVLRGAKSPTLRTIERVAHALDVDAAVFFTPDPPGPKK